MLENETNFEETNVASGVDSSKKELIGLGGWLVFFQIRIYFNLVIFFFTSLRSLPGLSFLGFMADFLPVILLILSLIFFYKKRLLFRPLYIIARVIQIIIVLYIVLIFSNKYYLGYYLNFYIGNLIGLLVAETIIIIALFKSRRVKNTFH